MKLDSIIYIPPPASSRFARKIHSRSDLPIFQNYPRTFPRSFRGADGTGRRQMKKDARRMLVVDRVIARLSSRLFVERDRSIRNLLSSDHQFRKHRSFVGNENESLYAPFPRASLSHLVHPMYRSDRAQIIVEIAKLISSKKRKKKKSKRQ